MHIRFRSRSICMCLVLPSVTICVIRTLLCCELCNMADSFALCIPALSSTNCIYDSLSILMVLHKQFINLPYLPVNFILISDVISYHMSSSTKLNFLGIVIIFLYLSASITFLSSNDSHESRVVIKIFLIRLFHTLLP
jgi:hypothetical protein